MKKIIALLICFTMVFSMVACAKSTEQPETKPPVTGETNTNTEQSGNMSREKTNKNKRND